MITGDKLYLKHSAKMNSGDRLKEEKVKDKINLTHFLISSEHPLILQIK